MFFFCLQKQIKTQISCVTAQVIRVCFFFFFHLLDIMVHLFLKFKISRFSSLLLLQLYIMESVVNHTDRFVCDTVHIDNPVTGFQFSSSDTKCII